MHVSRSLFALGISVVAVPALVALAPGCGSSADDTPDGGSSVLEDGAVVPNPTGSTTGTGTGTATSSGTAPTPTGTTTSPVAVPLEVRYVAAGVTKAVDPKTQASRDVLLRTYPGLARAIESMPWDVRDPSTGRYYAHYMGSQSGLYSVGADGKAVRVPFDGDTTALFSDPLWWGVASYTGEFLYLTGASGAFVAKRKSGDLAFGAPVPVGKGAKMVHDISPDGKLAIVSGVAPLKSGWAADYVVAPRKFSVFGIAADGTLGNDVSSQHAAFTTIYAEAPHFLQDGTGIVHEGDDDGNTGDHLYVYTFGGTSKEVVPQPLSEMDFNTPCALSDGTLAFWESSGNYFLRLHDPVAKSTKSAVGTGFPFTGYVRCR